MNQPRHEQPLIVTHDGKLRQRARRRRAARRTLSVLPTLLTLGNLLSGFAAIFLASRPATTALPMGWTPLTYAAILIFLGMLFDGLDGSVARLANATSELGEQLDSMADMVTFGVAPAFVAVQLVGVQTPYLAEHTDVLFDRAVLVIACIYVACTALRLARFNVEVDQPGESDHSGFKGLPSPGAAGTVASLVLLHQHYVAAYLRQPHDELEVLGMPLPARLVGMAMVAIMMLAGFAMVSRLRYVHVVNRYIVGRRARVGTIVRLVVALLLLAIYPRQALAAGFAVYALSAPAAWLWRRVFRRGDQGGSDGDSGRQAAPTT